MPYLFQKRGIRVIYKGSIFVQKSIAVNPQRICKCHRYIVLNGVSVILIQNQCRGHNANLFCQFPCGETLECPVILQILARCGAFFIGFVVKGQMNHDFAFRIEVNPCVIEITIGNAMVYWLNTGIPWRDLPERFGPWQSVYSRFRAWTKAGVWEDVLTNLIQQDIVDETTLRLDNTTVKVHQHASGAKKGETTRPRDAAAED